LSKFGMRFAMMTENDGAFLCSYFFVFGLI